MAENILLTLFARGRILSIDVTTAEEIDELDPEDPESCSEFVSLVKDELALLRDAIKKENP